MASGGNNSSDLEEESILILFDDSDSDSDQQESQESRMQIVSPDMSSPEPSPRDRSPSYETGDQKSREATLRRRNADKRLLSEEDFVTKFLQIGKTLPGETGRIIKVTNKGYCDCSIDDVLDYDMEDDTKDIVWFDIDTISQKDLQAIEDKFDLHPVTTEDISTSDCLEKIETFDNYLFVIAKDLHYATDSNKLVVNSVSVVLFPKLILTFHTHHTAGIPKLFFVVEQSKGKENFLGSSDWVLYAVLDAIVDIYGNYVNAIVMEADALDELVLVFSAGEQGDLLRRIGNGRRMMTLLRGHLWRKRDMLISLTSKSYRLITEERKIYFRDVLDHCVSFEQRLDASKETLNNLHQTYLARISLEVAEASNKMNITMRKFSSIATICVPLTLISSVWGMNVRVPGQSDREDSLYWFFGLVAVILIITIGGLIYFRRQRWI